MEERGSAGWKFAKLAKVKLVWTFLGGCLQFESADGRTCHNHLETVKNAYNVSSIHRI
jgi:hypothetical protein